MFKKILILCLLYSTTAFSQIGMWGRGIPTSGGSFSGAVTFPDGTVALPSLAFTSGTDNGFYWIGTDNFALATNGVKLLDFTATYIESAKPIRLTNGTEALPSLAWEDPSASGTWDVGFFLKDTDILAATIGGSEAWFITATNIGGTTGQEPQMRKENSNATNPTLIPDREAQSTGIGGAGGTVSVIAVGVEGIRVSTTTVKMLKFGNAAMQSMLLGSGVATFIATSNVITLTGHAGANTLATITGAVMGTYTIIFVDGLITVTDTDTHAANTIDLVGAFTSADDTVLQVVYNGTSWYEISRSVN
jgi:hypothetical protein